MKLIIISPSQKQESELGFLLNMFEQGLPTYHVRKKRYSTRQLRDYLENIPAKYHNRIVIHTHHELALKFKLKGVYMSRYHKQKKFWLWFWKKWLKIKRPDLLISTTHRSTEDVMDSLTRYNYIFLAPVFDSLSGSFQAAFSESNLRYLTKDAGNKVIARGGVSCETLEKARDMSFGGVAFYSSIWKSGNPLQEFLKVKEKFAELKIPIE